MYVCMQCMYYVRMHAVHVLCTYACSACIMYVCMQCMYYVRMHAVHVLCTYACSACIMYVCMQCMYYVHMHTVHVLCTYVRVNCIYSHAVHGIDTLTGLAHRVSQSVKSQSVRPSVTISSSEQVGNIYTPTLLCETGFQDRPFSLHCTLTLVYCTI